MNWLDFINVKDFKKNLPLIYKEREYCDVLKVSVKKIYDEKFGTCFLCDILIEQFDMKFLSTIKFGQYGLINEDTNEYEYYVGDKEFLKFMIFNLQDKKIGNQKYEDAYISSHKNFLLEKMNESINYCIESKNKETQERLLKLEQKFNPILIKANILNKNQENFIDYTDKNWIDIVDLKSFKEQALSKIMDDLSIKPDELTEIKIENNKKFGTCLVVKTFKHSDDCIENKYLSSVYDYINENGVTYVSSSYHYDYKFAQFGIIDYCENKYENNYRALRANETFCNFMVNETLGKTINHKTYADELNSFIEQQKQLIEQEELEILQKRINQEKKCSASEINGDINAIKENIKKFYSSKETELEENNNLSM